MKLVNSKLTQNVCLLLIVMFNIAFVFVRASITHAYMLIQYDITVWPGWQLCTMDISDKNYID